MSPFEPVGSQARWKIVYELLVKTPTDGLVSYAALGEALSLDPNVDRHAIQMAMRRAAREHEEVDLRAVEVVTNQGYRIVQAEEHLGLARQHQRRAGKALQRGKSKVVHVDFNLMDVETRKAFEVVAQAFQIQMDMTRRLDVRSRRLEETVQQIAAQQRDTAEAHDARLARLEGLLKRHGIAE